MLIGVGEAGYQGLPFEERCRTTQELGFTYMEIGIGDTVVGQIPLDSNEKMVRSFVDCIEQYNLKTPLVCVDNDFTVANRYDLQKRVDRVCREISLSKKFNATHIRLFTGFTRIEDMTEQMWENLFIAFDEVNRAATRHGIQIAVETHADLEEADGGYYHYQSSSTDWNALNRLLEELPKEIGINFDSGNLRVFAQSSLLEYVDLLNPRVNYCHLKDWIENPDGSWSAAAIGDSDFDWKPVIDRLVYNGLYIIEYEPIHDLREGIQRSVAYLKSIGKDLQFK